MRRICDCQGRKGAQAWRNSERILSSLETGASDGPLCSLLLSSLETPPHSCVGLNLTLNTTVPPKMGAGYSLVALSQWAIEGNKRFGRAGFDAAAKAFVPADTEASLKGQTHVVTGANAGLGLETASTLASRGAAVYMVCRDVVRGQAAVQAVRDATGNTSVHLVVLDVSDAAAVAAFAEAWLATKRPIHALINNAGVLLAKRSVNGAGIEISWATAMTQTYLLSALLLPALQSASSTSPARVINVASGGQFLVHLDAADPFATGAKKLLGDGRRRVYDGAQQYAHVKRSQVELTRAWAELSKYELRALTLAAGGGGTGAPLPTVLFASMHPGWADTPGLATSIPDFHAKQASSLRTPAQGVDTIVWLASAPLSALQRESGTAPAKLLGEAAASSPSAAGGAAPVSAAGSSSIVAAASSAAAAAARRVSSSIMSLAVAAAGAGAQQQQPASPSGESPAASPSAVAGGSTEEKNGGGLASPSSLLSPTSAAAFSAREAAVRSVSGLFWFDRKPVCPDYPLSGTAITPAERAGLWALCAKTLGWPKEEGSGAATSTAASETTAAAAAVTSASASAAIMAAGEGSGEDAGAAERKAAAAAVAKEEARVAAEATAATAAAEEARVATEAAAAAAAAEDASVAAEAAAAAAAAEEARAAAEAAAAAAAVEEARVSAEAAAAAAAAEEARVAAEAAAAAAAAEEARIAAEAAAAAAAAEEARVAAEAEATTAVAASVDTSAVEEAPAVAAEAGREVKELATVASEDTTAETIAEAAADVVVVDHAEPHDG